jgi:hypothetical protein
LVIRYFVPEKKLFMDLKAQKKNFSGQDSGSGAKEDGASRQSIDGPEHVL